MKGKRKEGQEQRRGTKSRRSLKSQSHRFVFIICYQNYRLKIHIRILHKFSKLYREINRIILATVQLSFHQLHLLFSHYLTSNFQELENRIYNIITVNLLLNTNTLIHKTNEIPTYAKREKKGSRTSQKKLLGNHSTYQRSYAR